MLGLAYLGLIKMELLKWPKHASRPSKATGLKKVRLNQLRRAIHLNWAELKKLLSLALKQNVKKCTGHRMGTL
jgi:hypothetical protein